MVLLLTLVQDMAAAMEVDTAAEGRTATLAALVASLRGGSLWTATEPPLTINT